MAKSPVHRQRLLVIYEFAAPGDDWMVTSLCRELGGALANWKIEYLYGPFRKYRAGGLRWQRLLNFAWIYAATAGRLWLRPPDKVFVRTTPPCIQLWTVACAHWWNVPVVCWLMDSHPEIEARALDQRKLRWIARVFRKFDRGFMPKFAAIVTLDRAMVAFARHRAPNVPVICHPTWNASTHAELVMNDRNRRKDGAVRIVHTGNLGAAHNLTGLEPLLRALGRRKPVEIHVVGSSEAARDRFFALTRVPNITVRFHSRVERFQDLGAFYQKLEIDLGLVLLASSSAGLVSPSKFSGYISFGLPLLYFGPPETNSADVCDKFGGGFHFDGRSEAAEILANQIVDPRRLSQAAEGARSAAAHFNRFNGRTLAAELLPILAHAEKKGEPVGGDR